MPREVYKGFTKEMVFGSGVHGHFPSGKGKGDIPGKKEVYLQGHFLW